MQHETTGLVDTAERAPRLERERGNPRDVRGEPGDMDGPRDGVARIALLPDEGDVVRRLVPDGRLQPGARAAATVATAGISSVSTTTSSAAAIGRLQGLGDDERNRLADGTDAVAGEHGTSGLVRLLAVRALQLHAAGKVRQPVGGQVLAGIDREHAG